MKRKKFAAALTAFVAGVTLSSVSAWAVTGYLLGDPAPGKLVPYYQITNSLATLIGIESVEEDRIFPSDDPLGEDVAVHVTIFNKDSDHITDFDLCLSPLAFGYIVLQQNPATAAQLADLAHQTGPHSTRLNKARVYSVTGDGIPRQGYLTLRATAEFQSHDGTCAGILPNDESFEPGGTFSPGDEEPLLTWAILFDVGNAFFATEIPTPTAIISDGNTVKEGKKSCPPDCDANGAAKGGLGAFGLIPGPPPGSPSATPGNIVIARYDVNPGVKSKTDIYVWLTDTHGFAKEWPAFLDCEDELSLSTTINLSNEVNIINPDALAGIGQCKSSGQFRGELRFAMPDTGFVWSQISQEGDHFKETFLGYNLECNSFIAPDHCLQ